MIPETASGALPRPRARSLAYDLSRVRVGRSLQLAIAYLAVAVPAVAMAFVQPVWQLTDEAQHTDVLAQYAHGVYPIEGVTTLRPETVAIMTTTGNYRWSPPETVPRPAVEDPAQFGPPPPYLSGAQYRLWDTFAGQQMAGAMSQQRAPIMGDNQCSPQKFVQLVGCRDSKAKLESKVRPQGDPQKR